MSFLKSNGIKIGNLTFRKWGTFDKTQDNLFIKWNNIKNLKLVQRVHLTTKISLVRHYLIIKTKQNKKYESIIYDVPGFLKTLKKINKNHLLTKDSKYK